jgi:hypothetical protein
MSRAPSTFRQRDLTRALKAAKAAGYDAVRITIKRGGVEIDERLANGSDAEQFAANPWDEVLTNAEDKKRAS